MDMLEDWSLEVESAERVEVDEAGRRRRVFADGSYTYWLKA